MRYLNSVYKKKKKKRNKRPPSRLGPELPRLRIRLLGWEKTLKSEIRPTLRHKKRPKHPHGGGWSVKQSVKQRSILRKNLIKNFKN